MYFKIKVGQENEIRSNLLIIMNMISPFLNITWLNISQILEQSF